MVEERGPRVESPVDDIEKWLRDGNVEGEGEQGSYGVPHGQAS